MPSWQCDMLWDGIVAEFAREDGEGDGGEWDNWEDDPNVVVLR